MDLGAHGGLHQSQLLCNLLSRESITAEDHDCPVEFVQSFEQTRDQTALPVLLQHLDRIDIARVGNFAQSDGSRIWTPGFRTLLALIDSDTHGNDVNERLGAATIEAEPTVVHGPEHPQHRLLGGVLHVWRMRTKHARHSSMHELEQLPQIFLATTRRAKQCLPFKSAGHGRLPARNAPWLRQTCAPPHLVPNGTSRCGLLLRTSLTTLP